MRGTKDRPHGAAAPLTLGDLTKAKGLVRFAKALNASPEDVVRVNSIAKKYTRETPGLADLKIGKSTSGDFYDIKNHRVALSTADPDILSHELGHANRLHDSGKFYSGLLKGTKIVNKFLGAGSIPIGGALTYSSAIPDKHRTSILKGLAAASVISAIPNLAEEAMASANAIRNSTEKLKTLGKLLPGFGSHALHDLGGAGTYLLFDKLTNKD
jgi:hypothetical protein